MININKEKVNEYIREGRFLNKLLNSIQENKFTMYMQYEMFEKYPESIINFGNNEAITIYINSRLKAVKDEIYIQIEETMKEKWIPIGLTDCEIDNMIYTMIDKCLRYPKIKAYPCKYGYVYKPVN